MNQFDPGPGAMQPSEVPAEKPEASKGQTAGALALLCILVVGVITPASLMVWRDNAHSAPIRTADVGTFISAEVSPRGFLTPILTTVHTTAESIAVMGTFSALQSQPITIEDPNKSGSNFALPAPLPLAYPSPEHGRESCSLRPTQRRFSTSTPMGSPAPT